VYSFNWISRSLEFLFLLKKEGKRPLLPEWNNRRKSLSRLLSNNRQIRSTWKHFTTAHFWRELGRTIVSVSKVLIFHFVGETWRTFQSKLRKISRRRLRSPKYAELSFHVVVLKRTAKKCTKIYNKRVQSLFCSWSLLFDGVLVAVAVVVCLRSLFSGPVYTALEVLENAALFLRLGLPSTLIRHENGAFRKRSSNRRNLKTPAFHFRMDRKHFENGAFRKRWHRDSHVISLTEFSSNTKPNDRWLLCFQVPAA